MSCAILFLRHRGVPLFRDIVRFFGGRKLACLMELANEGFSYAAI